MPFIRARLPMTADSPLDRSADELQRMRNVLKREAAAIDRAADRIDSSAIHAVDRIMACTGRVITTGMGKMGCVARKAAATFCSTGTPAFYLQPAEAVHGDLGIVSPADVLLALSKSGESKEVLALLPFMSRFQVPVVAMTGSATSELARRADVTLLVDVEGEADTIALAPTCSTTVALAMCDALAVALMHRRGFTREQFAIFHPGGSLGRKLLLTVDDLMHTGTACPTVSPETSLQQAIVTISEKRLGATLVVDDQNRLLGILTDGDLRRTFERHANPLVDPVARWMIPTPLSIRVGALAAEALKRMEDRQVMVLPVVDASNRVQGMVHLHDLVRAGLA